MSHRYVIEPDYSRVPYHHVVKCRLTGRRVGEFACVEEAQRFIKHVDQLCDYIGVR